MTPWQSGFSDGIYIGDIFRKRDGVGLAKWLDLNPLPSNPCDEWLDGFQYGMHNSYPQFILLGDGTTVRYKPLVKHILEQAEADRAAAADYADEDDEGDEANYNADRRLVA